MNLKYAISDVNPGKRILKYVILYYTWLADNRLDDRYCVRCDCGNFYNVSSSQLINCVEYPICPCTFNNIKNLVGQIFGRLVVIAYNGIARSREKRFLVQCSCGADPFEVAGSNLEFGNIVSCGCYGRDVHTKHNCCVCGKPSEVRHRTKVLHIDCNKLYRSYEGMHDRCYDPNGKDCKNYLHKGIVVCQRWNRKHLDGTKNKNGRQNFYEDAFANGWKPGYEPHRIDNNGNYEPNNIKWISPSEHRAIHTEMRRRLKCKTETT